MQKKIDRWGRRGTPGSHRRRWARMTFICMAFIASLALAEDWLGEREEDADPFGDVYSDPWDTDYEADPWSLHEEERQENSSPERFRIYDDRGRSTGRAERNSLSDDTFDLYDDRGRRTGRVERDALSEDDFNVYDDRGRRVREIRRNPILDDQYDVYDETGRRTGRIRKNPVIDGQYDLYDEQGRRIGRVDTD